MVRGLLVLTVVMVGCCGRAAAPPVAPQPPRCLRAPPTDPTTNVVWGVITDERGAPIAGATVEVTMPGTAFKPRPAVWGRVTSDADGRYLLQLASDNYTLHFSRGVQVERVERSPHSVHTIERLDVRLDGEAQEHWVDPAMPTCHDSSPT